MVMVMVMVMVMALVFRQPIAFALFYQ